MVMHPPIRIAGSRLGEHRHVAAFFETPAEEHRIMFPFFLDGMMGGERGISVVPKSRSDYRRQARTAGLDADSRRRQFDLRSSEDVYAPAGRLDVDAMLSRVRRTFEEGRALGFPSTRLASHGERALTDPRTATAYLEYESRLNDVVAGGPDVVVCAYDLRELSTADAFEVLRVHPMAIVKGVLQENPFYVPPSRLLPLLRRRARARECRDGIEA
jgi:hypothetical protein